MIFPCWVLLSPRGYVSVNKLWIKGLNPPTPFSKGGQGLRGLI